MRQVNAWQQLPQIGMPFIRIPARQIIPRPQQMSSSAEKGALSLELELTMHPQPNRGRKWCSICDSVLEISSGLLGVMLEFAPSRMCVRCV
jgi:hypothetical protein